MQFDLPFIRPHFPPPEHIAAAVREIVASNTYSNFGPKERELSTCIAQWIGRDLSATTTANATLALVAALHCGVGRGSGDTYVLTPSFSFVAAAHAISWTGHVPLFIDVDPHTWQPSLASGEAAMERGGDRVVGILLANVFGVGNADIGAWEAFADRQGLPLIIDSAAGLGSQYSSTERVGGRGLCEIFSMHATKSFGIGEGGVVVSRDPLLIGRVNQFQNFGFGADRSSRDLGLNAKLPEMSAAIGLLQLHALADRLAGRRAVFDRYVAGLGDTYVAQPNAEFSALGFGSFLCRSSGEKEKALLSLADHRVQARDYYSPPVHRQPHYAQGQPLVDLQVTEDLSSRMISVPLYDSMSDADIELVLAALMVNR